MPPELTGTAWTQIRYDYEHTERPIGDICAEHGISSGTLRDRVRRWGWTPRRAPIPREGPPALAPTLDPSPASGGGRGGERDPAPACEGGSGAGDASSACEGGIGGGDPAPACEGGKAAGGPARPVETPWLAGSFGAEADSAATDERPIAERLQRAVARLLPAIEANVAKLAAGPMHPREMERAARALAALTRTLRELNDQQRQHAADEAARVKESIDLDKMRRDLALRLEAMIAAREEAEGGGDQPLNDDL